MTGKKSRLQYAIDEFRLIRSEQPEVDGGWDNDTPIAKAAIENLLDAIMEAEN